MNAYHDLIPTFSPVAVKVIDVFSNEDSGPLLTIDALSDWVYEESTHYLGYSRKEFVLMFIERFNEFMMTDGSSPWEFKFIDSTYTINAV